MAEEFSKNFTGVFVPGVTQPKGRRKIDALISIIAKFVNAQEAKKHSI